MASVRKSRPLSQRRNPIKHFSAELSLRQLSHPPVEPPRNHSASYAINAAGNPFSLLVETLSAHFEASGATASDVFIWLDVFLINQHNPGSGADSQTRRSEGSMT